MEFGLSQYSIKKGSKVVVMTQQGAVLHGEVTGTKKHSNSEWELLIKTTKFSEQPSRKNGEDENKSDAIEQFKRRADERRADVQS